MAVWHFAIGGVRVIMPPMSFDFSVASTCCDTWISYVRSVTKAFYCSGKRSSVLIAFRRNKGTAFCLYICPAAVRHHVGIICASLRMANSKGKYIILDLKPNFKNIFFKHKILNIFFFILTRFE